MRITLTELKQVITEQIRLVQIFENIQLADKIYFNTQKLSPEDKNILLSITNGDNYSKLIADIMFEYKNSKMNVPINQLKDIYNKATIRMYSQLKDLPILITLVT